MDIVKLKQQIQSHTLDKFYIFSGEEIELQQVYIKQIGNYRRVDTVAEVYPSLTSKMIKSTGTVYVVRDDNDFMKTEKAWTGIKDKIKNGTLILCVTNIDKRSAFYKHYKDDIIQFEHMTTNQLTPTISRMINGRPNIIQYFIESCGNDYNTILNNIDKFNRMSYVELTKDISDILAPREQSSTGFELTNLLMAKDYTGTIKTLDTLLKQGESPLALLALICKMLRDCVLVVGGQQTELNGWVAKKIKDTNRIQPANLLQGLRIVYKYDNGIKCGLYEPEMAINCAVLEILTL